MLRRITALAGLLLLCLPAPALAISTHTFTGADNTDSTAWGKAANWDDNQVPADGDLVVIPAFKAVKDVPSDKIFTSVTLQNGAGLIGGGPLTTGSFSAGCAYSQVSVTVLGAGDIFGFDLRPGPLGEPTQYFSAALTTVRQPLPIVDDCDPDTAGRSGRMRLFSGTEFVNDGVLIGNGTIEGMNCCTAPQVLDNTVNGVIDGSDGLTIATLRLEHRGRMEHGTVTLDGGVPLLTSSSRFSNVLVSVDGAVVSVGPPGATRSSTVTLGAGATFALFGRAEISGLGTWTGPGTLALREGYIYGRQVIDVGTTLSSSGPDVKVIRAFSTGDPGEVIVNGTLKLDTGTLTIGGRLVVHGTATVARGAKPVVDGMLCCTEPVNPLRIDPTGRLELARTSELTIRDMRLDTAGKVLATTAGAGPLGKLVLDGGTHLVRSGSELGAPTEILDLALVSLAGTSTVSAPVTMTKGQLVGPIETRTTPRAVLAGAGTGAFKIVEGTVSGDITFRKPLAVTVTGPELKVIGGAADIRMQGATRIEGPGELRITSGARLGLAGTTTLAAAVIDASGCCTNPAELDIVGPTKLADGSAPSTLTNLKASVLGELDLNGRILEADGLPLTVGSDGSVNLRRGTLRSDVDVAVRDGGKLVGPGTVVADTLRLSGTTSLATRGRLLVRGSVLMKPSSTLRMVTTARARDRLEVTGAAVLDGELVLRGVALLPRRVTWTIVRADDRVGTFDRVTGRAGQPIAYDLHAVRI